MNMTHETCPDCQGELIRIKLYGRGWENPISGIAIETDLQFYAEAEAQRSARTGKYTPKGEVESFLCNSCGRIFLFGSGGQ
jgi:hypothetical protein